MEINMLLFHFPISTEAYGQEMLKQADQGGKPRAQRIVFAHSTAPVGTRPSNPTTSTLLGSIVPLGNIVKANGLRTVAHAKGCKRSKGTTGPPLPNGAS